jgi:predicted dehydrogenase
MENDATDRVCSFVIRHSAFRPGAFMTRSIDRRTFLSTSTATVLGASLALRTRTASARILGANDRVRVGVIGTGRQGTSDMRNHMSLPDVEIAAICDVYGVNLAKAAALVPSAEQHKDFREVLDRKDIDAVIIGTPDHWHALMTLMACQAGKDVYVEKPTSVAIAEGRRMVEAARKYNRVVQVGTQQRSAAHFQQAVELVGSNRIGRVSMVRCWNANNQSPNGFGNPPDGDPPADLDWDLWLGPAPKVPFNPNRFGVYPDAWSYFRYFWDYAGGMMTDWGVHLIDIVQWVMKVDAPLAVSAVGGKLAIDDNRETPDTIIASYQYPGFVMTYENRSGNSRDVNGHGYGIEFYGTDGTLFVDRSGLEIVPETRKTGDSEEIRTEPLTVDSTKDDPTHAQNFVACIKSRERPICDIEIGHRSSSAAILGNLAYRSGASLKWDSRRERVEGNDKAGDMLDREYRSPWKLTV